MDMSVPYDVELEKYIESGLAEDPDSFNIQSPFLILQI